MVTRHCRESAEETEEQNNQTETGKTERGERPCFRSCGKGEGERIDTPGETSGNEGAIKERACRRGGVKKMEKERKARPVHQSCIRDFAKRIGLIRTFSVARKRDPRSYGEGTKGPRRKL